MDSADLTLKEAAVLADVPEKAARHEIARGIANPAVRKAGKARRRALADADLLYLHLVGHLPVALGVDDRRDLYALLAEDAASRGRWRRSANRLRLAGPVEVSFDVGAVRRLLTERLRLYRRGQARVVARDDTVGGEPVFKGTRIPVRHVGALAARDVPVAEIVGDYPALTPDDVAFARLFVAVGPGPGRPRRRLRLVRGDRSAS